MPPTTAPEGRLATRTQTKGCPGHQVGCALGSGSRDFKPHAGPVTLGGHRGPQTGSAPDVKIRRLLGEGMMGASRTLQTLATS